MRTNRTIKQIQYWVEDSRAYLWVPALICLAASFFIWNAWVLPKTLTLKLRTDKPGTAQIFVNDGSGYSEPHSLKASMTEVGKKQVLNFDLTAYPNILSIRVDPIDNDSALQVFGIEFKNTGRWLSKSVLKPEYRQSNQIRFDWKANKNRLDLYPDQGSRDPYFILVDHDFNSVSGGGLIGKQILFHVVILLLGTLVAALTAKVWIWAFVHFIYSFHLLFVGIRWLIDQYTFKIDRLSIKWYLVNPTSCAVAGLAIAALATYLNLDRPLFAERLERRGSEVVFEVSGGSTHSVHVFYGTRKGYSKERSRFMKFEPKTLPYEVRVPLPEMREDVVRLRIDPLERAGEVTLSNIRIINYAGTAIPISMKGWKPSRTAQVIEADDDSMTIVATGSDPYVVSPDINVDLSVPFSIPIYAAFPFGVWFFTSLAFLIYNRIITEGMSMQKIRMLQR